MAKPNKENLIFSLEAMAGLLELEALEDEDCHASPEDGCEGCAEKSRLWTLGRRFEKIAERIKSGELKINGK